MNHTADIADLNQRGHPIDLCLSILNGKLLKGCTVVCTSRPFSGLRKVSFSSVSEIIGLTPNAICEFVHKKYPKKAADIMSELKRNPILSSVCGITFYCMAISNLLNEGVTLFDEDVKTYTRLTAFVLVQLVIRKLSHWPFLVEVSSYFDKLAKLAHLGIFHSEEFSDLSKIVFNEWDLIKVHLTPSDLESIKKVGLLKLDEAHTGHRKSMTAEFFHLSMQELLSVVHIVSNSLTSKYMLERVFASGQFNMALLYLFGVQYDTQSQWISDVRFAVQPSKLEVDKDTQKQFQLFLQSLCKNCSDDSSKKILFASWSMRDRLKNRQSWL